MVTTRSARAAAGGPRVYDAACDASVNIEAISAHPKRRIECVEERGIAERLEHAIYCASRDQVRMECLVALPGDENDRDLLPAAFQFALKSGSGHAGHGDVEEQTAR